MNIKFLILSAIIAVSHITASEYEDSLTLWKKGNLKEASDQMQKFIHEHPDSINIPNSFYYLGRILEESREFLSAAGWYQRYLRNYSKGHFASEAMFRTGRCYFDAGVYGKAEIYLLDFLKAGKPTVYIPEAWTIIASNYASTEKFKEAAQAYRNAIIAWEKWNIGADYKSEKDRALAILNQKLAFLLVRKLDRPDEAYDALSRSMELGGSNDVSSRDLFRKLSIRHLDYAPLKNTPIADILPDGDDVYVVTWTDGLFRFSRSANDWKKISLPSNQIRAVYSEKDNLYIASFDGIFVYSKKSETTIKLPGIDGQLAQKIMRIGDSIYISTLTKGVIRYQPDTKVSEVLDNTTWMKSSQVFELAFDSNWIYFGSIDIGIIMKNRHSEEVRYLAPDNGLPGDNVKALLPEGRFLWIALHGKGVFRYDTELKKITRLEWSATWPSALAGRGPEIWAGTSGYGIYVFNREKESIERIRAIEGLASNEIYVIKPEGKRIWIGYLDGGVDILYRPLLEH